MRPLRGGAPERVILKHGKGGQFADASSLASFIQNVRCGDRIRVQVALVEKLARFPADATTSEAGGASSGAIATAPAPPQTIAQQADVLWHAITASILEMHVQGNVGGMGRSVVPVVAGEQGGAGTSPCVGDATVDHQQHTIAGDGGASPVESGEVAAEQEVEECNDDEEDDLSHKKSSKERFRRFADFIACTFQLPPPSRIIEVAGGAGALSLLLSLAGHEVLLVDPRSNAGMLKRRLRKQMRRVSGARQFQVSRSFFSSDAGSNGDGGDSGDGDGGGGPTTASLLADFKPDLIVGLHPDEATGAIVEVAAAHGVPFAVVPCCTYARLFPGRRLPGGRPVRTHRDLCEYLRRQVPGSEVGRLTGIQGKTTVIFHRGKYGENNNNNNNNNGKKKIRKKHPLQPPPPPPQGGDELLAADMGKSCSI